ncbi:MAG: response regulator [Candidatus Desulfofervidaceae bacterium]|nr:response regulator [Candidatus Desulfofervidaceae bacterium]
MNPIILVVDDNLDDLKFIKEALSDNYTVIESQDGKAALEKLASGLPDLILLDLKMPGMSGIEFLKETQAILKKHCIPIIVMTAYPDEWEKTKTFYLGCCDFIEKPLDLLTLKLKLQRLLQMKNCVKELKEELSKKAETIKLVLEDVQQQKNYLRSVIETISEGIWVLDLDFTVKLANRKMGELFGIPAKELVGKKCFDCFPSKCCHTPLCPINRIKAGEKYVGKEGPYVMATGEKVWLYKTAAPFKNEKGELIGVIQTFHDITPRKQVEEELKATVAKLKEAQSFIIQQGKLMAIGQLAAGIAHEMNNPLGFVASNFRTLKDYVTDLTKLLTAYRYLAEDLSGSLPEFKEKIREIKKLEEQMDLDFILDDMKSLFKDTDEGIKRLTEIIKNLRDFSRVDQIEDYTEYDINEGIKSTLVITKNEYKYYAEVKTELGEVPLIYCHPGKINEVLMNIIVNAAQAIASQNRQEKGTIFIKTYSDGEFVYCQIKDDGPGIPKEIQDKIFDPFFTTKPTGKGTGLGLNICYDIVVNKHQGQIWVESEPGKGATFTIKLPIKPKLKEEEDE